MAVSRRVESILILLHGNHNFKEPSTSEAQWDIRKQL